MSAPRPLRPYRGPAFAGALALLALLGGCGRPAATPAADDLGEGRHRLVGSIVSVNAERGTLLVDHEEIPGFMAAMTMELKVAPGDLANARPGQRIRGVIYRSPEGFHLENIWPIDEAGGRIVDEAAKVLRQETVTRGRAAHREIGERLPGFALYDQSGAVVQPASFRGRQLVVNFIFTRCPDPAMCPAATMRMMRLQELAREAGVENFHLLSITLDPEFDTPGVLRDYAAQRGIDTSNFSFLTGPEGAIKDLMTALGVLAFDKGPLLKHTLSTTLFDDTGKLIHRADGSAWEPAEFAARLRRPAAPVSAP